MILSSYIYALVANAAYEKNEFTKRLPGLGWECLIDDPERDAHGYHGVAYINKNPNEKVIIIGHRGTLFEPSITGVLNLMADAQLFFESRPNWAWEEAKKFSENVRKDFPSYTIAETGHSLGGVYAALNACYFGTRRISSIAVTYDNPGIGALIRGLNPLGIEYNSVYTQLITHLARPNAINTAGVHIGECYYIETHQAPVTSGFLGFNRIAHSVRRLEPFGHAFQSHSLAENILNAFNNNGVAKFHLVANEKWPKTFSNLFTSAYYLVSTGYAAAPPALNHQASPFYS